MAITFKGGAVTLLGRRVTVGEKAPEAKVVNRDMAVVSLKPTPGKVCLITSVPSLDTPVCDAEIHKFNEEVGKLGAGVELFTVSMDLPFAQKRWCGAIDAKHVQTFSDFREASFGKTYGTLIQELHLLTRAVFVVDKAGIIRYVEYVPEITTQPQFDKVLETVKKLL